MLSFVALNGDIGSIIYKERFVQNNVRYQEFDQYGLEVKLLEPWYNIVYHKYEMMWNNYACHIFLLDHLICVLGAINGLLVDDFP